MSTNLRIKSFKLFKNPEKKIPGSIWAKIGLRKTQPNVDSKRRDSESWTRHRWTKPTTAPWNLNGARSIGAPTHPLVTVFTKRPVIGGGRRPGVWFSGLREERRTPRATSRPLHHGSTWHLPGSHLHSPTLPDTNRVGRGLLPCRDQRPIAAWAVFEQRVDNFQRRSASSAAYSSVKK